MITNTVQKFSNGMQQMRTYILCDLKIKMLSESIKNLKSISTLKSDHSSQPVKKSFPGFYAFYLWANT